MFRFLAFAAIIVAGACAGALIGLIAGAAALETGQSACEMQACADTLVRNIAPAGALAGALFGFSKARSLRRPQDNA